MDLNGTVTPLYSAPGAMPRWAIPSRDGKQVAIAGAMYDFNAWMVELGN